ncbi:hypothetical protein [Sphingomonas arenae]|uniref:hypothetical protein n=1 Tax=Sphingomonas arenae TaxID=2812555 RepID=UPI001967AC17|nr:hypothetical protein [Sphingomonas arenae]
MQQNDGTQGGGLGEKQLAAANAENEDAFAGSADPSGGELDDVEFSNEHPLSSPGELAGTADQAIAREIAALGPADGSLADAAGTQGGASTDTIGDAIGAAAGMDVGSGTPGDTSELRSDNMNAQRNTLPVDGQ